MTSEGLFVLFYLKSRARSNNNNNKKKKDAEFLTRCRTGR